MSWRMFLAWLALAPGLEASAQISFDGSLGPAGPLAGPEYRIAAEAGRRVGGNLFHSFTRFDLAAGESATFTGPAAVTHILARVTGDGPSAIHGRLRTEGMPGADLLLINPHGILFGPDARLELGGSFATASADRVELVDGGHFQARFPGASVLTAAPPSAFGFLGTTPGLLRVTGTLTVGEGLSLTLAGGELELSGGRLVALDGRISLFSLAGSGIARLGSGSDMEGAGGRLVLDADAALNTDGQNGGRIVIRGGALRVEGAGVSARTLGDGQGGGIDVGLSGVFQVRDGLFTTDVIGSGVGGNLIIRAERLELSGQSDLTASTLGAGSGGDIDVEAGTVLIADPGGVGEPRFINPVPRPDGSVELLTVAEGPGISTNTFGSGQAGDIRIRAERLELSDAGIIAAATFGPGAGGGVTVTADQLRISRGGTEVATGIFVGSLLDATGDGGNLEINVGRLELLAGGVLSAETSGPGRGGVLGVRADEILISAANTGRVTGIGAPARGRNNGGDGGDIRIQARRLILLEGSAILAATTGDSSSNAGNIDLELGTLFMRGAAINARSAQAGGGRISLNLRESGLLVNSTITTRVFGGPDSNAGDIAIGRSRSLALLGSSHIEADAREGRGGSVRVAAQALFQGFGSAITASSELGVDGMVALESAEVDPSGGLVTLPARFFDATAVLDRPCAGRADATVSSLTVQVYEALPNTPSGLRSELPAVRAAAGGWTPPGAGWITCRSGP